jgi:hypothetical protein
VDFPGISARTDHKALTKRCNLHVLNGLGWDVAWDPGVPAFDWIVVVRPQRVKAFQDLLVEAITLQTSARQFPAILRCPPGCATNLRVGSRAAEMIVAFVRENKLATIVGEPTAGRLLSATSVKVGEGYRLALPTGAYYTWKGSVLEGTPIEPDELVEFDWRERRGGVDTQLNRAIESLTNGSLAQAS